MKLALVMALLVLINSLILGYISYNSSRTSLEESIFSQLTSVKSVKKKAIKNYFENLEGLLLGLSKDKMICDAAKDFSKAYDNLLIDPASPEYKEIESKVSSFYTNTIGPKISRNIGENYDGRTLQPKLPPSVALQYEYSIDNGGQINKYGIDLTEYTIAHEKYNTSLNYIVEKNAMVDLFIIDKNGRAVYTTAKEPDFGCDLINGAQSKGNLATAFKNSIDDQAGKSTLTDFEVYMPALGNPCAFISAPIYENNEKIGVIAFQLPIQEINEVMTGGRKWKEDGLGETGETYLVGEDYKLRSTSRFFEENTESYYKELANLGVSNAVVNRIKTSGSPIMFQEIKTEAATDALNGNKADKISKDYKNTANLCSYEPVNIMGLNWAIIAEKDQDEAYAPIYSLRNLIIVIGLVVMVVSILLALFIAGSISKPILQLVEKIGVVASGDLTVKIEAESKDEVGDALNSMKAMVARLKETIGSIKSGADNILSASTQMASTSQQMSEGATEQASSVEEISSSMEEMTANIQQNTTNSKETEKISTQSATDIIQSNVAVEKTVDSMKTIAGKISIIGEISRQTNLLALNAAVEAARAGEHGKGFAVVAAEVRKLAERSQLAASEIDEVSRVSVDVAMDSGARLKNVVPAIQKTANLVQEIAASSIEQNAGAEQVNNAIQQLNQVVQENAAASEEMAASAEELNAQAETLKDIISFFKIEHNHQLSAAKPAAGSSTRKAIQSTAASERKRSVAADVPRAASGTAAKPAQKVNLNLSDAAAHDGAYEKF